MLTERQDKMNKAVGIGACVMDTLINMPNYPKDDTKMRAESSKQAGGGPVATGLVAAARLGAETEYIGVLSDDADGRQRTAANQIFTRLLRRKTRFGDRRPEATLRFSNRLGML